MRKPSKVPHPTGLIKRNQLNHEVLYYIFEAAYREPRALVASTGKVDPSTGILCVDPSASIHRIEVSAPSWSMYYDVEIFERNNVIRFGRCFEFREGLDKSEKLELLNELRNL